MWQGCLVGAKEKHALGLMRPAVLDFIFEQKDLFLCSGSHLFCLEVTVDAFVSVTRSWQFCHLKLHPQSQGNALASSPAPLFQPFSSGT